MKRSIFQIFQNALFITCPLLCISSVQAAATQPSAKETAAIFKAAGFHQQGKQWVGSCGEGTIENYQDLNQDGLPEALITDSSSMCYGNTGTGYYLLSKNKHGQWKQLFNNSGVAEFLKITGQNNMPDISNGGPGFCFAVYRWNGKHYEINRYEYEGKRCKLN
ncbi:hypothetical protein IAE19_11355 [Acinetobacter sp. S40]|uniref:hypothetical protein n=1 Tax=unclassified Acinetobacter TaxID=196816 RepID=UPI00190AC6C0|nr:MULTISPECIES: hypothetical protein [unclassified Acinetobacter]MBJ9986030.1 hypothetical protein [Acinetobacter sp. S40]MBK0064003.1 hypothetical protein [Acinetobacter sp. S55]MBK0067288.1 hypothetical protein [Acinetobacter sp. S54]